MLTMMVPSLLFFLLCLPLLAAQAQVVPAVPQQQHQLQTFAARLQPLPQKKDAPDYYRNVTGTIVFATTSPNPQVEGDSGYWLMFIGGTLSGLEPNLDASNETVCGQHGCQVDLRWGTCDNIRGNAYECGGKVNADGNPWKRAKYNTDKDGRGILQHFSAIPNYGSRWDGGPEKYVAVVRSPHDGKKVACGKVLPREDGTFAKNHTDVVIETSVLYNHEVESTVPPIDASGLHESVVDWTLRHGPTTDGTTVMALDIMQDTDQEQDSGVRCYVGYTKVPSRAQASTFLTTTTHNRCSVYNHTGNGNKAQTKTSVMNGVGRKTNATTFLFANNYDMSDGDGGYGKAWFGGCTRDTPKIDTENSSEASTAMAKTASSASSGGGLDQEDIVAMIDSLQENLACGVQQEHVPPPTPAPTPAPSMYALPVPSDLAVNKNAAEEGNGTHAVSSGARPTVVFPAAAVLLVAVATTMLLGV